MRFIVLIIILSVGSLFFSTAVHADTPHPEIRHHKFIPNDPAFERVRKAYKDFNYPLAIRLTNKLIRQKKDLKIAKAAAFLLGDIYFDIAENGRPLEYKRALLAFRSARSKYKGSEESIRALWRIGTTYLNQRLFYEAFASYNLIIKNHPESHFSINARFGKAKTYFAWKKYKKAIDEYDLINPIGLNHDEKMALLLGYGETYHELNMLNTAYSYYKLVPVDDAILAKYPDTIFQYGFAALRSRDYGHAITLFSILQDRYPGLPDTLLSLARMGDAWRLQSMSHRAKNIYKMVRQSQKNNSNGQIAKITAAVGTLHLAGCSPKPILLSESDCKRMNPLTSKVGLAALERIRKKAEILFSDFDNPTHRTRLRLIERTLLEALAALEQHHAYTLSLQLKEQLLQKKIQKSTRKKLDDSLQKTVIMATSQFLEEDDSIAVLTTFFEHRNQYSGKILNGDIGLQIGIQLTNAGFYQEAVKILQPIAKLTHNQAYEKALYYLVKANYRRGAYEAAEQGLRHHIKAHPESPQKASLELISAEISEHEGHYSQAIKKYRSWLENYPRNNNVQQVRLALARVYEENGDLQEAITRYLKVAKMGGAEATKLQIKAADLYFSLKKYKKAASHYEQGLKISEEGPQKEWIQVQLANSYAALGQKKSKPLFTQLAKQAEDDIIKGFAEQKSGLKE